MRALSLVNGNSRVRLSVIEALISALNSGGAPPLDGRDKDIDLLSQLADALAGQYKGQSAPYISQSGLKV